MLEYKNTIKYFYIVLIFNEHVTQWIEYQIPILEVEGSNPFLLVVLVDTT
jgi:hypothetical protein